MQLPTILLVGGMFVGLVLALIALAHALVASGVSGLRLRLWRQHDQIVDELVAGEYANEAQAREVLAMIRMTIAHAREFTFLRVFGAYLLVRLQTPGRPAFRSVSKKSVFEGTPDDDLLKAHVQDLSRTLSYHVVRTSLLGHFALVLLPMIYVLVVAPSQALARRVLVREVSAAATTIEVPAKRLPEPEEYAFKPIRTEVKRELVMQKVASLRGTQGELAGAAC